MKRTLLAGLLCLGAATASAQTSGDFRWTGALERGKTLEIKDVNGRISAEPASGNQIEVVATKHGRRSDPASVRIEVVPENGNVTICAVYPTPSRLAGDLKPNECKPGSAGRMNTDNNDVVVDFTVRLPEGIRLDARTVNGGIEARALKSDISARSVNGKVDVTTSGVAAATTVNGAITASIGSMPAAGPLAFTTVNGSITLSLPKSANANLHASTTNGSFSSDLPLLVRSMSSHKERVEGTLGNGGADLRLDTVNGSIYLRSVTGN